MKINKSILATLLLITSCLISFNASAQESALTKQLVGEWRNQYVRVKMNIYDKTAKPVVMEADTSNWEQRLEIKPIRTHFMADGSYYSEYRDLKDSIINRPSGTWTVKADTLIMTQLKPTSSVLKLQVKINNNLATFSGIIDFGGDGKKDDEYYGVQKKYGSL